MVKSSRSPVRCGIVLAPGEGKRLRPFIQRLRGKDLPKQFVNFIGTRSMLEHTRSIKPMNFSKGLSEAFSVQYTGCLGVLPVRGVFWSDWGSEQRISSIIRSMNSTAPSSRSPTVRYPMERGEPTEITL